MPAKKNEKTETAEHTTENFQEREEKGSQPEKNTAQKARGGGQGDTFIYIGPTTNTGLSSNTIFTGTREAVEQHLKDTIEKIPQVRHMIVRTEKLAENKAKAGKHGTVMNKYYNDILCMSGK